MNASTKVDVTETQQIEEALHTLVTAAISDTGYASNILTRDGPESIGSIIARFDAMTAKERKAHEIIRRPIGEAVRRAIKTLGERLHEIGGQELMSDVMERVADRDPRNYSRRVDVLDKRFDGIGNWVA
jgi:hypothetical protein